MPRSTPTHHPPLVVIYGDEEYQKQTTLQRVLDELLPGREARGLSLIEYDAGPSSPAGLPDWATVMDDLATLPLLADRRVVLVRDAEAFVAAHRERLERYLASPVGHGTLVLVCRSFPKTTRLYKAALATGGRLYECRKLTPRGLIDFVLAEARARGKRMDYAAAARLVDHIGPEQGMLAQEVEKLALYASGRTTITEGDVTALTGQTREERIFAVMDAAATGDLRRALELWDQVLVTDPEAPYKALGGAAFVVRRWLAAQREYSQGVSPRALAPRLMMWGREQQLAQILDRLPAPHLMRILARIAELDSQAKIGQRTIENAVAALLTELAGPAGR